MFACGTTEGDRYFKICFQGPHTASWHRGSTTRDTSTFGIGNSIGKYGLKLCGCLLHYLGGAMINLCGSLLDLWISTSRVAILATGFLLYKAYVVALAW